MYIYIGIYIGIYIYIYVQLFILSGTYCVPGIVMRNGYKGQQRRQAVCLHGANSLAYMCTGRYLCMYDVYMEVCACLYVFIYVCVSCISMWSI